MVVARLATQQELLCAAIRKRRSKMESLSRGAEHSRRAVFGALRSELERNAHRCTSDLAQVREKRNSVWCDRVPLFPGFLRSIPLSLASIETQVIHCK